jgi:deaminated glutathione amidase
MSPLASESFIAAIVQLQCNSDSERNWNAADRLIRDAAAAGATLVVTPENTTFLGPHAQKVALAEPVDGPTHARFGLLAKELGICLLVGSVAEIAEGENNRCHNTSLLFGPDGSLISTYRKVHLFDVDVEDGVRFKESDTVAPGSDIVVANSPVGRIGMSICYDLRFPEFYRKLVDGGAQILTVPSAFTQKTGTAHWHVLLRARAIENQAWILAPGQVGLHDDDGLRHSYGHSLIINPWGEIVAEIQDGEGYCTADIDLNQVTRIRTSMPVQDHRRF